MNAAITKAEFKSRHLRIQIIHAKYEIGVFFIEVAVSILGCEVFPTVLEMF